MDFDNKKTELLFNDLGEQKVKNTLVHAFDLDNPDLAKRSNIDENTAAAASAKIIEGSVPPTIAVLPFANLSTDQEQEFFADGITEDTISYFSKSKTFPVVSINSVMKFKNSKEATKDIAKDLSANFILRGLRNTTDFEFENSISQINKDLNSNLEITLNDAIKIDQSSQVDFEIYLADFLSKIS